jgi:signal peptidase II
MRISPMTRLGLASAIVMLAADQASKAAILSRLGALPPEDRLLPVFSGFNLALVGNHGVTFGLFNNGGPANAIVFSVIALVIVIGLIWSLGRTRRSANAVATGMIIGGAIGNALDRLRLGAVVDFLDFYLGSWHWYVFNIADAGICVGVTILLLDSLLVGSESPG